MTDRRIRANARSTSRERAARSCGPASAAPSKKSTSWRRGVAASARPSSAAWRRARVVHERAGGGRAGAAAGRGRKLRRRPGRPGGGRRGPLASSRGSDARRADNNALCCCRPLQRRARQRARQTEPMRTKRAACQVARGPSARVAASATIPDASCTSHHRRSASTCVAVAGNGRHDFFLRWRIGVKVPTKQAPRETSGRPRPVASVERDQRLRLEEVAALHSPRSRPCESASTLRGAGSRLGEVDICVTRARARAHSGTPVPGSTAGRSAAGSQRPQQRERRTSRRQVFANVRPRRAGRRATPMASLVPLTASARSSGGCSAAQSSTGTCSVFGP